MKFDPTPLIRSNSYGPIVAVLTGFQVIDKFLNELK